MHGRKSMENMTQTAAHTLIGYYGEIKLSKRALPNSYLPGTGLSWIMKQDAPGRGPPIALRLG